ncbi:hypothetical protein [Pontibacter rugosus]
MQLPVSFSERMQRLLGDEYNAFVAALEQTPPVSIRVNKAKAPISPGLKPVPWASSGYYLPERPSLPLTRCCMPGRIMYRRQALCFWSRL